MMSCTLMSSIPEIDRLVFRKLPSRRPVEVIKAVRIDKTTVFLDAAGNIYSTQMQDGNWAYTESSAARFESTIQGAIALGKVSKAAADAYVERGKQIESRRSARYLAEDIGKNARELGVKLTETQKRKLRSKIAADCDNGTTSAARQAEAGLL